MTTLADKSLLSGGDNKPPMLEKHLYDSWKSEMERDGVTRLKEYIELTPAEAIQADCDIKAINIILQGLPTEIYALVSQHRVAKDLWEKIKLLMQGTSLTKQERECKLYDEFDKFTYKKGESLHEYYLRFTLYSIKEHLQDAIGAISNLHTTNVDQLHAYLQQHERHANEVRLMQERNSDPCISWHLTITSVNIINLIYSLSRLSTLTSCFTISGRQTTYAAGTTRKYTPGASGSNTRKQQTFAGCNSRKWSRLTEENKAFLADPGLPDTQTSQTVITHNAAYQSDDLMPKNLNCDELNSAKIALMANLSRNGSDALTEVHNPDNLTYDLINQSEQIMTSSEQSNDVNQTETEITSDSNIIPYSQYLSETQQETVQNSNSSAQQDVLILSMFEQLNTQVMHCTNVNLEYKSANKALTTELDRYKEEVKDLKEMQNVENSFSGSNEQYAEIERLKQTLSEQVQEKDSLMKTVSDLKNDLKMEENRNIDREIALEKKIKQLDNIIFKRGQSAQTVHMMTKSKICYDHSTKQAIGFEKPFYLKKVRESKPKLYDGNVILKMDTIVIPDSDETLMLCEESRSKMLLKEQDPMVVKHKVNTKPINYAILNNDYNKRFVRQSDLYSEHAYWKATLVPTLDPSHSSTTIKVEVPKELPKVSMVYTSLKELKRYLTGFDQVVKERTTATAITEGTWGFEHTKACFRDEIIPFIKELKDIFNNFNQYLVEELADVQKVFYQMEQAVEQHRLESRTFKCLELKTELLNKKDFVDKETYDKLCKSFTTLEKHCITLETDSQLNQEIFQQENSVLNQNALSFTQLFELSELRAQSQAKDTVIVKLKEQIKSLKGNVDDSKVKMDMDEIETLNIELEHRVTKLEQGLVIAALKNELRKLKGKAIDNEDTVTHSVDPKGFLRNNMEPNHTQSLNKRNGTVKVNGSAVVQNLKKQDNSDSVCINRDDCMSSDNLCVSKSMNDVKFHAKPKKNKSKKDIWKPTGKVFTQIGYIWKPTGRTFTIVGNACPLTRITTTNEVPSRKPIALESESTKPVVKLVYSRKPRKNTNTESVSKTMVVQIVLWYLDSGCSKHMTGDRSQLTNFISKFLGTVKFGNDQVAKIMGYGDYQIGNVTISRVYYVEGLGHNLFSVGQFCDSNLEVAFRQHTCFIRNLEGVDLLTGSRGDNLYTLSLGNMMASSPICLLSKASKTKSWLWHRRLSHLNFGAINHLARHGLVRGLPKLKFEKDHLCSACALGKSSKKPHKPKSEDTNQEKLYLLHMDLCGPMRVASVNGKKYILVIVDDYSRFTWVKCLRSKDEAPIFIINFLKMIQVRLKETVRRIRTDNGTEFVNQTLREYYEKVGISHETSVARSPQQNGVVERRKS
ncbi:retrovirus-related pol polyprotein from transposon TNT 1-94 [Tanacetum coccineum]